MSTEKRIVVHVGIHKTGSTSIQAFLGAHRTDLRNLGIDFFTGAHLPDNHVELHLSALREGRESPFQYSKRGKEIVVDTSYRDGVRTRIREYVAHSPCPCVVFSAEGLSYLRYPDEMQRLGIMLPGRIEIVIYLREAAGFLASYRRVLRNVPASYVVERDSFAYIGEDSWLVDFESRVAGFRRAFQNVTVLDYDRELSAVGNVIPSFLKVLGIEGDARFQDWGAFFLNRTVVPVAPRDPLCRFVDQAVHEEKCIGFPHRSS